MSRPPAASFIIPTYGRAATLLDTVRCALAQNHPDFEVIVASQDPEAPPGLEELCARNPDKLRLLRLPRPNANAARNAAIEAARGAVLLSIDDDVLFGPDYAARHAVRYADERTGFVMSLTLDRADQPESEARAAHAGLLALPRVPQPGEVVAIKWSPTCSTSYRRAAVVQAGWFDPYFTSTGPDDADIAVRIIGAGYAGYLDTGTPLVHLAATSGGYGTRDVRRTLDRRLEEQRMRLYFAAKNRRLIGWPDAAALFAHAFRTVVRTCRDRDGIAGWFRAPLTFTRLAWRASRDARRR